jgi:hypothetical protein
MSDQSRPDAGFPTGFDMFGKIGEMMRTPPFAGAGGAGALEPSLAMMSDFVTPLTSVEELDKRIAQMRAVEQWLKLNLGMLQSSTQAMEVQRATLATLRAFGALGQPSPGGTAGAGPGSAPAAWPFGVAGWPGAAAAPGDAPPEAATKSDGASPEAAATLPGGMPFDPSAWWNVLQTQFSQLAAMAAQQPASAPGDAANADKPGGARRTAGRRASKKGA